MKTKQIKMDPELARDDSHRTAADLACRTSTRKTLELVCGARAKATMRAPSFPLEDLATGKIVEMKDLWKTQILVMEFGSFT
jgi:hypothetical protein